MPDADDRRSTTTPCAGCATRRRASRRAPAQRPRPQGAFGTWWTGRLSDAAGLLVAPPLSRPRPGARVAGPARSDRVVRALAVATVGALFALVKVAPLGAAVASAAWSLVDDPTGLVRSDATDLAVLPVLAPGVARGRRYASRTGRHPPPDRSARWLVVLPVAVLATVATSTPAEGDAVRAVAVVDGVLVVRLQDGERLLSTDGETWSPRPGRRRRTPSPARSRRRPTSPSPAGPIAPTSATDRSAPTTRTSSTARSASSAAPTGGRTWQSTGSCPPSCSTRSRAGTTRPPVRSGHARSPCCRPPQVTASTPRTGATDSRSATTTARGAPRPPSPEGFDDVVPIPRRPDTPLLPVPPALPVGVAVALVVVAASGRRPDMSVAPGRRATKRGAAREPVLAATAVVDHAWRTLPGGDDLVAAVRVLVLVALLATAGLALVGAARRGPAPRCRVRARGARRGRGGGHPPGGRQRVGGGRDRRRRRHQGVVLARRSTARHAPWPTSRCRGSAAGVRLTGRPPREAGRASRGATWQVGNLLRPPSSNPSPAVPRPLGSVRRKKAPPIPAGTPRRRDPACERCAPPSRSRRSRQSSRSTQAAVAAPADPGLDATVHTAGRVSWRPAAPGSTRVQRLLRGRVPGHRRRGCTRRRVRRLRRRRRRPDRRSAHVTPARPRTASRD